MRELADIWTNRHLVSSLARQDLRRVQAGTTAGLAWAVLTPLVPLLIFTVVLCKPALRYLGADARRKPMPLVST